MALGLAADRDMDLPVRCQALCVWWRRAGGFVSLRATAVAILAWLLSFWRGFVVFLPVRPRRNGSEPRLRTMTLPHSQRLTTRWDD